MRYEASEATRLRSYGWRTVNVDYRPGARSLVDVIAWYDWVRATYRGPICAFGRSAGAQLVLMLAARRDVDCVIGDGVPTDLRRVGGTAAAVKLRRDFIKPAFGDALGRYSPVNHPARREVKVLLANSVADPLFPCRQLAEYKAVRPATMTYCLPAGHARSCTPMSHAAHCGRSTSASGVCSGGLRAWE